MSDNREEGRDVVRDVTRLQRIVDREKPGYVILPRSERHGKPDVPRPDVATVEDLKARYARKVRR
jgi:hypothetical protein